MSFFFVILDKKKIIIEVGKVPFQLKIDNLCYSYMICYLFSCVQIFTAKLAKFRGTRNFVKIIYIQCKPVLFKVNSYIPKPN